MLVGKAILDFAGQLLAVLLTVGAAVIPLWFSVRFQCLLQSDPEMLRACGVVIRRPEALDAVAETIGSYAGADIHGAVTFKGMHYEFDRVVPEEYREHIRANELFLDPGLVYVTRGA